MDTTPTTAPTRNRRWRRLVAAAGTLATVGITAAGLAVGATASAAPAASTYKFQTLGDHKDTTFNQLLSINDQGRIGGYFGVGSTAHPNKGYVIQPPYAQGNFTNENFPGSVQTQVTAINDSNTTGGFYADAAGDNFGFILKHGVWTVVIDPHTTGNVNQVLGVNNNGLAVGFYTDSKGNSHGFEFNFHKDTFSSVNVPGATQVTATGVNFHGDITGFYVNKAGDTDGFLLRDGHVTTFSGPGSTNTMPLGINNSDKIVGSYAVGNATHGFVRSGSTLSTVDDPSGAGTTVINGLNNNGELVGFYTVDNGNITKGFLAVKQ